MSSSRPFPSAQIVPSGSSRRGQARGGVTSPAVRLLGRYLDRAAAAGASDLHFEPCVNGLRVRIRVDGVLRLLDPPPATLVAPLIARLRLLARVDLSEQRMPQDGCFQYMHGKERVHVRAAFLPALGGVKVALRLLCSETASLGLKQLGMDPLDLTVFEELLARSNGMTIVVGPTGSGKTTTLYAALEQLRSDRLAIMTVEDPVERDLPSVTQVAVDDDTGRSFAVVLRAFLRQDPDVIMVGEMRDPQSARIACRAALTGHRVLSTLHTADTREALVRLAEMGVEPYLLCATVSFVIAQRLLRRLCSFCRIEAAPSPSEIELFCSRGLLAPPLLASCRGCPRCLGEGYRGRIAIFETLLYRRDQGGEQRPRCTLLDAGLARAAKLQTTIAEVLAHCPTPELGPRESAR